MKPVFIIAIVAVAMIGVMVPNIFAEEPVCENDERDCSSGSYGYLCKESENIIWDKNTPLVWDNFQGIPGTFMCATDNLHDPDTTAAWINTAIDWSITWEISRWNPCEYDIVKVDAVATMSPMDSWFYPDRIFGSTLKHEQGHFDITQIYAQKFKADYEGKSFSCPSNIDDDNELMNWVGNDNQRLWSQHADDWIAMQTTYDLETNTNLDNIAQAEWNKKIKSLLISEKYVKETSILEPTEEQTNEEGGGCLIATATYGSEMSQQVQQLRELRDNQLMNTGSGSAFMATFNDIYYSFSPTIADMERENPYFKEAVKLAITPMISSLSLMENANSESKVLGIGISVIMLNIGMYLGVPAIVIVGIRKKF